jgi:hypothetical protein
VRHVELPKGSKFDIEEKEEMIYVVVEGGLILSHQRRRELKFR